MRMDWRRGSIALALPKIGRSSHERKASSPVGRRRLRRNLDLELRIRSDRRKSRQVNGDVEGDDCQIGAPKVEGKEAVGGKDAPGLYFGTTKINNNFEIVDTVGKEDGAGMTATLFVKGGDEFIRVSTSVPKPDGSGRAIGTVLAGPALESIKAGKAHYGEVPILGTPYMTGYEPIKDGSGATIGVYYVGYKK